MVFRKADRIGRRVISFIREGKERKKPHLSSKIFAVVCANDDACRPLFEKHTDSSKLGEREEEELAVVTVMFFFFFFFSCVCVFASG